MAKLGEVRLDRLAERGVERVDRPVALGGRDDPLVADVDLDGRLGRELARGRPRVDELVAGPGPGAMPAPRVARASR